MSSPTPVPERTEEHSNTAPARPRCSTDSIVCHPNGIVERVFRVEGNSKGSAFEDDDPVDVDFCCDTDLESVSTSSARPDPEPADEQDLTCKYRYLSLTCGKKPGSPYECDPSKGKDTWVVVMDSGFEPDAFPHEFNTDERAIRVNRPPPEVVYGKYCWNNKSQFSCHDDSKDRCTIQGKDNRPVVVGHGTTVALVAGGSRIGVAPRANLLLYKVGATYYQHKGTEDQPLPPEYRNGVRCQAFIHCLEDLIAQLDAGALPKGKTVVSISFYMARYIGETESKRRKAAQFWGIVNGLLDELSHRGVTVVACAGNRDTATENSRRMIKDTTADIMPPCHARDNESLIVVGGVDGRGRLWWGSVPGTEDCQVHVYAQGYKVDLHSLDSRDSIVRMSGTSFAAPQVAGLAAYFLGHPDYAERLAYSEEDAEEERGTVGERVKDVVTELATEWQVGDNIKRRNRLALYPTKGVDPVSVHVACNGYDQES